MGTAEWIAATYLVIGAARPLANALGSPSKLLDEPEIRLFAEIFGRSPTALIISVSVVLASVISALFWPLIILLKITGHMPKD